MKNEMRKTELLIDGDFTESELDELRDTLKVKDIKVLKYFTKGVDVEEIVRIIFRGFDAYQFLRDGFLFELLMFTLKQTMSWIKKKKPNARITSWIDLRFKSSKKEVPINIGVPLENKKSWSELEKTLTIDFMDSIKEGEITNIYWDVKEDKVKITKI